ncbi:7-carboxy-7-deazaguanine synthase-like protein [Vibrio phage 1.081.O._10N.286.52.C2]|nr:7-carboxy-7-deazaguanine synthase-like protein [Vibrio phage 1.081.O._10N.286.52.C2]
MQAKWTEMFYSIQGEGRYTGQASLFFRFWGCNLECHGFGQEDPTDPDTYVLDFKEFDPKSEGITSVEDLPVFQRGCDSSYTWAKKYSHLAMKTEISDVCEMMLDKLPNRKWGKVHWVITGGEPMMNQPQIVAMMEYFQSIGNMPAGVTIETNGTQPLKMDWLYVFPELNFSVSFKLFNVTGELNEKAIKPEIVNSYAQVGNVWLKPVVVDTEACWNELDMLLAQYTSQRRLGNVDVYVMPCGATQEEQEQDGYMKSIANKALARGYNVSARMHVWIYGNAVGT